MHGKTFTKLVEYAMKNARAMAEVDVMHQSDAWLDPGRISVCANQTPISEFTTPQVIEIWGAIAQEYYRSYARALRENDELRQLRGGQAKAVSDEDSVVPQVRGGIPSPLRRGAEEAEDIGDELGDILP